MKIDSTPNRYFRYFSWEQKFASSLTYEFTFPLQHRLCLPLWRGTDGTLPSKQTPRASFEF